MGIGKRILNVLIGLLFIISVTVLGSSFLAKKVLVDAISQAGVDTAISHRMMDAVFGYAGADDTEWIAKIQNKIEKNGEVQAITQKVMNEITEDLSSGKAYKDVDVTKELNRILDDSMQEIKDTNPELSDDMLAMMKQQLKEELVDVQDVLNSRNVSQRRYVLEGYLAPDTYEIYIGATASEIIRKLITQTERVFSVACEDRAEEMGYTMDEILTLASMIEKEASKADFAKVSAVFHNRLKAGMKLQSDVTIHYITGVRKMSLTGSDLALDSLYNTYQVTGLPLGPICAPSADAINAALYPDETFVAENYLYFCATSPESTELHFSRTLQEHEQAVAIYAPLWQQYDKERGIE